MMWSTASRFPGESTRVPSSRYHAFKARPGTSALICSTTGWSVRANSSGPKCDVFVLLVVSPFMHCDHLCIMIDCVLYCIGFNCSSAFIYIEWGHV